MIRRIKQRMSELNISYQELSDRTEIPKSTINRWVTGVTENIPMNEIEVVSEALNVSPSWLVGWDDEKGEKGVHMKNKWKIKKEPNRDELKSVVIFEDTHDLLKELKNDTGVSMAEIMRSALLYAYNNLEIEE